MKRYQVTITQSAEEDILTTYHWYEDQQKGLGKRFRDELFSSIKSLQLRPLSIQVRYGEIRVSFVKKFPYGIHFHVRENSVLILAVFHCASDPEKWKER
jgi:plasmid stabilization system protein ParE